MLFLDVGIWGVVEGIILARDVWTEFEFHFHNGGLKAWVVNLAEIVLEKVVVFRVGDLETVGVKFQVGGWTFMGGFKEISILHLKNE